MSESKVDKLVFIADVGGFCGKPEIEPETEMLVRWYQVGVAHRYAAL